MVPAEPIPSRTLVTCSDFGRALRTAAGTARLAPSSHNCQPWALLRLSGADARASAARLLRQPGGGPARADSEYVAVVLDRGRQLDSLASHELEMQLSCGAFTQLLTRTLACQGWWLERAVLTDEPGGWAYRSVPAPVRALRDAGWRPDWSLLAVLELRYAGMPEGSLTEYQELTAARRTNRGPYQDRAVPADVLEQLLKPAPGLAAEADLDIRHLTARTDLDRFVSFVARYAGRDFSHPEAWRETYAYIRPTRAEAERRGDGFALSQLFGPLHPLRAAALRTALRPATMRVLRHVGYPRVLASRMAAAIRPTPAVVAMGLTPGSPGAADVLRAGARLADYWLTATRHSLALHPISIVLQHEDLRERLQSCLGLPGRTVFVSRLGHAETGFPPAPRRGADTFTHTL
ncbi:RedV protein [Streptomyces alfalfae]|uniref:RedV protein n=1 Tax=Streptomyces alfalfae TaxID=1642299 RepID=UPI001F0A3FE4|nr:RedV protein [Streptomyces alfalfae]